MNLEIKNGIIKYEKLCFDRGTWYILRTFCYGNKLIGKKVILRSSTGTDETK